MKIHGSIEALHCTSCFQQPITFPWMKIHGSIEASGWCGRRQVNQRVSMNENSWLYWSDTSIDYTLSGNITFPWMKIHGSIEAHIITYIMGYQRYLVSMNENSWLYWSIACLGEVWSWWYCFHEWKFMALLKHVRHIFSAWKGIWVSMNENSWLYWSLPVNPGMFSPVPAFPWMKIHGSIEASGWTLPSISP